MWTTSELLIRTIYLIVFWSGAVTFIWCSRRVGDFAKRAETDDDRLVKLGRIALLLNAAMLLIIGLFGYDTAMLYKDWWKT